MPDGCKGLLDSNCLVLSPLLDLLRSVEARYLLAAVWSSPAPRGRAPSRAPALSQDTLCCPIRSPRPEQAPAPPLSPGHQPALPGGGDLPGPHRPSRSVGT